MRQHETPVILTSPKYSQQVFHEMFLLAQNEPFIVFLPQMHNIQAPVQQLTQHILAGRDCRCCGCD